MSVVIAMILTVIVLKIFDKVEPLKLKQEIHARDLKIKALEEICAKYETEFGLKESARILSEIEINQPKGEDDHE